MRIWDKIKRYFPKGRNPNALQDAVDLIRRYDAQVPSYEIVRDPQEGNTRIKLEIVIPREEKKQ